VKLRLKFRGREMAHTDLGFAVMTRAVGELVGMGHPDAEPKLIGRNIHVMLTPLAPNKRKPKFQHGAHPPAVDDGPDTSGDDDDEDDKPNS
jgi:translation initiation factor IF-3